MSPSLQFFIIFSLLIILIALAYKLLKIFEEFFEIFSNEFPQELPGKSNLRKHSLIGWIEDIGVRQRQIASDIQNINCILNCDNPAGSNSASEKTKRKLITLYAEKLLLKEGLSEQEAFAKASFEISYFNIDEIKEKINGKSYLKGWNDSETVKTDVQKAFLKTGILFKDCLNVTDQILPIHICVPIWYVFKGYKPLSSMNILSNVFNLAPTYGNNWNTYKRYVFDRAIMLKLLDLHIISVEKTPATLDLEISIDEWLEYPVFRFTMDNYENIISIVYNQKDSHRNEDFEELYRKGEAPIFELF